ncbi:MAG: hypothetical protein C5B48_13090 [Candidatus Rokuibacteriota bacterium]|nr:MAG: hypothetical protein C5B48_13090 [Candidatus Rokubacteria bacterium]
MIESLTTLRRSFTLMLLLGGIAAVTGGCIFVPVGGYGYSAPPPVVVAPPPPVVVVRPHRWWWY